MLVKLYKCQSQCVLVVPILIILGGEQSLDEKFLTENRDLRATMPIENAKEGNVARVVLA